MRVQIGGLERRDSGLAVHVDIDVEMANRCDALLRSLPAAWAKWIGGYIDVCAVGVFVGEPCRDIEEQSPVPRSRSVA